MNIKQTSLGLLGVSVGMGAILGLAPVSPIQAASLDRDIVSPDGQTMGRIQFTWDDSAVVNNMLNKFTSLTSFSLTDYGKMGYKLEFAKNAEVQKFEFDIATGYLTMWAFNGSEETLTGFDGFLIESEQSSSNANSSIPKSATASNIDPLTQAFQVNTYQVVMNGGSNLSPAPKNIFVEPQNSPSVPENSLTTALLIVAGLVFLSPNKMF